MNFKTNALTLLLFFARSRLACQGNAKKAKHPFHLHRRPVSSKRKLLPGSPDWVKTPNIDSLADKGSASPIATWGPGARRRSHPAHRSQTYGVKSMRMEGEYPGSSYDSECPFWPAVSGRTVTRPLKLGNGTPARTMGLGAIGTSKKFGTVPPSRTMQVTISRSN